MRAAMIDFTCPHCFAAFSVPDHLSGRRAKCKKCKTALTVPAPEKQQVLVEQAPPGPRLPPRTRRLKADADQMKLAFEHFPLVKVRSMQGEPPEKYEVEYFVRGLERVPGARSRSSATITAPRSASATSIRGSVPNAACSRRFFIPTSSRRRSAWAITGPLASGWWTWSSASGK
ncbi:MAG: MJ0042-type zinc finger domain-containing protein [Tepidisphaeraceae bacterium]